MKLALAALSLAAAGLLAVGVGPLWAPPEPSGTPQEGMTCHFVDSAFVAFGGRAGIQTWVSHALRIYDKGSWQEILLPGPGGFARSYHTSVVYQGRLYVFGGRTGLFSITDELLVVDPREPSVRRVTDARGEAPSPRQGHAAALLGTRMYVHGGSGDARMDGALDDLHAYDLATNTWESLGPGGGRRKGHQLVAHNGRLHVFGGSAAGSVPGVREVAIYDPATRAWAVAAAPMPPRAGHTATEVDGQAWLIGGLTEQDVTGEVLVWDLGAQRLVAGLDPPYLNPARQGHCAALGPLEGKPLHVLGGSHSYSQYFGDLQRLLLKPSSPQSFRQKLATAAGLTPTPKTPETCDNCEKSQFFMERAKKIWAQYHTITQSQPLQDADVEDLKRKAQEALGRSLPGPVPGTVFKVQKHCQELEGTLSGETTTRARLEEQIAQLRAELTWAEGVTSQQEVTTADLERLRAEAEDWKTKLEDLNKQVREAEAQYESYDRVKEGLKDELRKYDRDLGALRGEADTTAKTLRIARVTLKTRLEQYEASSSKQQGQAGEIERLEKLVAEKEEEIADAMQRLAQAEADETAQDLARLNHTTEALEIRDQIARIERLLMEQRSLSPKMMEAQRVQQSVDELAQGWIIKVLELEPLPAELEVRGPDHCLKGSPCRPALEEHYRRMQDKLVRLQRELEGKAAAQEEVERRLQDLGKRRIALGLQLSQLRAELSELQRQLANLRQVRDYDHRTHPRLEAEWRAAQTQVDTLEGAQREIAASVAKVTEAQGELKGQLQAHEQAFGGYAEAQQRLAKDRHAAALQYEKALEALEGRLAELERSRKDRQDLPRRLGDALRSWEDQFNFEAKYSADLEALLKQLTSSGPCDRLLARKDEDLAQLTADNAALKKAMAALKATIKSKDDEIEGMMAALTRQGNELSTHMKEIDRIRAEQNKL